MAAMIIPKEADSQKIREGVYKDGEFQILDASFWNQFRQFDILKFILPFRWTPEQIETLDRLCDNIRRETIDMEKVIARLMKDNRNLRQEVESLNHIVSQIKRKEKNV